MVSSKILVNQWRKEPASRDQLSHDLAFTKSAQEPGWNGDEVSPRLSTQANAAQEHATRCQSGQLNNVVGS